MFEMKVGDIMAVSWKTYLLEDVNVNWACAMACLLEHADRIRIPKPIVVGFPSDHFVSAKKKTNKKNIFIRLWVFDLF